MMKLSDYIFSRLAEAGVRHVFMVSGGGAMHLNDSLGKEERLQYICNHHEQACAMAAEGYSRVTGKLGVLNVTSGPGGINALNGVFGAWTDSIPMLVLSGQVKRETCLRYHGLFQLRQLGDQEADIIALAQHITKYAVFVDDPQLIRYHLERALHLATTGRPGPCWLDIPLDVQAAQIDETSLPAYDPAEDPPAWDLAALPAQVAEVLERLHRAERPVILAGSGVRQAHAAEIFRDLVADLGIPVVLSRTAKDLLPATSPQYCGRGGIDADRAGNFVVRNADLLLVIGSRLGVRQTGYNWDTFAPAAYRIHVDADPQELSKPNARAHLPLCYDARLFLEEMRRQLSPAPPSAARGEWLGWCSARKGRYPGVREEHRHPVAPLNPYHFLEHFFGCLGPEEVIVCGNGAAFIMAFQTGELQPGQRMFFNSGCASMGWDLPAAVGAAVAREGERVICLAGDGSLQMNVQEMQTAAHHGLPIKLFVLNNSGYLSIHITQASFFGRFVGESAASGVSMPDFVKVATAYGWTALRLTGEEGDAQFDATIRRVLETPGPVLCEVIVDPRQEFEPRSSSKQLPDGTIISPPLEDMYPFLDREELEGNLVAHEETEA
jgi:acetolactate synthase-1/2/3 large subunit